jgi:hypothetical protein
MLEVSGWNIVSLKFSGRGCSYSQFWPFFIYIFMNILNWNDDFKLFAHFDFQLSNFFVTVTYFKTSLLQFCFGNLRVFKVVVKSFKLRLNYDESCPCLGPLSGEFHDQGHAKWIVIRMQLRGHNDTPLGRPTRGLAALRAYFVV